MEGGTRALPFGRCADTLDRVHFRAVALFGCMFLVSELQKEDELEMKAIRLKGGWSMMMCPHSQCGLDSQGQNEEENTGHWSAARNADCVKRSSATRRER